MITRLIRLQVLAFVAIALLGTAFVGVRYVGLGDRLLGGSYLVDLDLAVTGGIFPHASVNYRGVPVGRVDDVTLRGTGANAGVLVRLRLDRGVRVPTDVTAVITHRSAVGEQYVDLRPNTDAGPFLRPGDTIPRERTSTPLPVETLLSRLDALITSVGVDNLTVVIDELGKAFEGNETSLRRLLDANSALLAEANRYLPETLRLVHDANTVLATQLESAAAIRRWASSLAKLAATLRAADPDLRRLLAEGPPAAAEIVSVLRGLDPTIGTLLGNLVTVNGIAVRRLAGIEQILVIFPISVATGFTVAPGDGTVHFGLVVNLNDPPPCKYVRDGVRNCTAAERAQGSNVRGSQSAPRVGGPATHSGTSSDPASSPSGPVGSTSSASTASVSGYDPATGLVIGPDGQPVQFGGTGGQAQLAGDQSWKQLLLAGIAP